MYPKFSNIYVKYGHLDKKGCVSATHDVYTIPLPHLSKMYPKFSNIYVKYGHLDKNGVYFSNT
jgi:hypothetical protein